MPARNPSAVPARVRMLRIARHLFEGGELTARWIMRNCGVVESVARRDMEFVRLYLPVHQTHRPHANPHHRHKRIRLAAVRTQ